MLLKIHVLFTIMQMITLDFGNNGIDDLRPKLNFEYGSKIAIEWFQENHMMVNGKIPLP